MSLVSNYQMVSAALQSKDSRWLQLEACREFQRGKCTRNSIECKFAHPPPQVEVQNGKVTACFDSIKGRCNREKPPCKYFHPPQHLKEQLLINGRNNLAFKNALMQQLAAGAVPMQASVPMTSPSGPIYAGLSQYYSVAASPPLGDPSGMVQVQLPQKLSNERLEGEPVYDAPVYYNPFPTMGVAYKRNDKGGSVPYYMSPAAVAAYQQAMLHQQQQSYLQQYAGPPPPAVPRYSTY